MSEVPEIISQEQGGNERMITVSGMYQDWFLDYASYVILERAVPAIEDGFKPVQLDRPGPRIFGCGTDLLPHHDAAVRFAVAARGLQRLIRLRRPDRAHRRHRGDSGQSF